MGLLDANTPLGVRLGPLGDNAPTLDPVGLPTYREDSPTPVDVLPPVESRRSPETGASLDFVVGPGDVLHEDTAPLVPGSP